MADLSNFFDSADSESRVEFLRNLKIRFIEQKFLYFGEGVDLYYAPRAKPADQISKIGSWPAEEFTKQITDHVKKEEKLGIISLGCGSATRDRMIMDSLHNQGYTINYVGVDSSSDMVKKASESMKDTPYNAEIWTEDIVTYTFTQHIGEIIKTFDRVIFLFLEATIGNMVQTEIVDTLFNLMDPKHLILFDCVIRQADSKIGDLKLFNFYANRLKDERRLEFMFHPLKMLGIPREVGTTVLENIAEESIGVLNFRYSFRFQKPFTIQFMDEYVHFIPPEKIKLQEIRAYHPETMISYFQQHDFHLVTKQTEEMLGLFLFEKN